ncbi:MAG: radical SAM protein [Candidatus Brocadiaceae bacterium]|nr:radical SAM protein [Candidatus Brocadiaceae bacterium]
MNCVMTKGIYLRANGNLACYCGTGSIVTLASLDLKRNNNDFVSKHYFGPSFQHIRESMANEKIPFPGICEQCDYLDIGAPLELENVNNEIEWFHWEPSYLCNLDCEWCCGEREKIKKEKVHYLPLSLFAEIVDSISKCGLKMKMGNICGQGEPLLNKNIWKMVAYAKNKIGGNILVSSNGNAEFNEEIVTCGLDKIKLAIDGITQETYARYRKNGSLKRVLDLTKNIAAYRKRIGSHKPSIIWQYLLFDHNDSEEELIKFQQMATDYEVNQIRIVYTRTSHYSKRNPDDFPQIFPDIIIHKLKSDNILSFSNISVIESEIESLESTGKFQDAVKANMKMIQKCYKRLVLGVTSFDEYLKFINVISYIPSDNPASLTSEEYRVFTRTVKEGYERFVRLYKAIGDNKQMTAYQNYINQLSIINSD